MTYVGVFRLEHGEVNVVGFADDLALVLTSRTEDKLMERNNSALQKVSDWMSQKRLTLAPEKTETIMLSGRKRYGPISF